MDLALVWALIIAFAILAYVLLDGFDLGLGILFPFLDTQADRDTAINSVAPVWDGNETWLVLGGGGLFAVFPLAYSTILPALYAPLTAMLLGLILRGVAFEFRWRSRKRTWDASFIAGSCIATLCQGIALGTMLQGIRIEDRAYAGGWWDWLTPFSVVCGIALVIGYGLLGATWLILKTRGSLQKQAYRLAFYFAVGTLVMIGCVSLWTPFLNQVYTQRWFDYPAILYTAPVPVFVALTALALFNGLKTHREATPFLGALVLFVLCFIGLGINFYPYIVPPHITIWHAAAPDASLEFLLAGAVILIPVILVYTAHAYWVFRGKVGEDEGYH